MNDTALLWSCKTSDQTASLHRNATIHQINTNLATCKNVLFLGTNHLITTSADDLTL